MTTVTFAGSGDAFGSGGRLQSCIHLQPDGAAPVLLDCGASSLIALKRQGLDPNAIAGVVISHLHVDHFGGLPYLILDGQFSKRTAPLTVAGPAGITQRLTGAMELMFPGSTAVRRGFEVDVIELSPAVPTTVADVSVQAWHVDHGMIGWPCLGLRAEVDGRTVGYTGDTGWTDALVEIADQSDLFIAESYVWDKKVPYHLRYADLAANRDRLTSARTILTHMSTDMLDRADKAEFELAHDGLAVDL